MRFRCITSLKFSVVIPSDIKSEWWRHYLVLNDVGKDTFMLYVNIENILTLFLKFNIALTAFNYFFQNDIGQKCLRNIKTHFLQMPVKDIKHKQSAFEATIYVKLQKYVNKNLTVRKIFHHICFSLALIKYKFKYQFKYKFN